MRKKESVASRAVSRKRQGSWWRKNGLFALFFCAVTVYYVWRLFCIPPWYDELHTYENFIDRGMIYSMIHWPLPNNHVLYSALSALINHLGSP